MSVLSNVDLIKSLNKKLIIHPFSEDCLSPLGYDLRIGMAGNLNDINESTIKDNKIILFPFESIQVVTLEKVWLSEHLMGTLHSRGTLSAKGLILNSTTVDPNWKGQMTFMLHNIHQKPIELEIGDRFVTLVIHSLHTKTHDSPRSNPISVAVDHSLPRTVLNSQTNDSAFEELVKKATKPTLTDFILKRLHEFILFIKQIVFSKFVQFILSILLLLDIASLLYLPFGGFEKFSTWFNLDGNYQAQVLFAQITLFVTLILALKNLKK